ncbi:MAG: hypothetical protein GY774_16560 [Planctomycetes bacterium]|nr:hypothetical protein [Planctomycetota bacterium]
MKTFTCSQIGEAGTTNQIDEQIKKPLLTFLQAVELADNLEIIGTAFPGNPESEIRNPKSNEVFVLRDHSIPEGIEGAFIEVSIQEIINTVGANCCLPFDKAMEFVDVINNARPPIVLQGITRIVGYYSRVNNWNKSKVGELRDRANGNYGLKGKNALFHKDRMNAINSL